jgi:hypothetical protein
MNRIASKASLAAAALILASFAGTASATDRQELLASTMHAVGQAIASQGNAALIQIREELRRDLSKRLKPLLPSPQHVAKPAPAVAAKR